MNEFKMPTDPIKSIQPNKKFPGIINIIVTIVVVLLFVFLAYYFITSYSQVDPILVDCTQDTKTCPDGSEVGRVPPDCNFKTCPGENPQADCLDAGGEWKTLANSCVDSCEYEQNPNMGCFQAETEGCDCGPSMCWYENRCITNEDAITLGWNTHRMDEYGLEFRYPNNVSILMKEDNPDLEWGENSILRVEHDELGDIFSMGTAGDIAKESDTDEYILTGTLYIYDLAPDCSEPFFGKVNIPSYNFSFGDGGWSVHRHNILTSNGTNLVVSFHTYEIEIISGLNEDEEKAAEKERQDTRKGILESLKFDSDKKAMDFKCKNKPERIGPAG